MSYSFITYHLNTKLNISIDKMDIDDEMSLSLDQPCQELKSVDIFNTDVISTVKDIYNPIYSKIRIYGDYTKPVFIAKDVQDVLGLKNMHYKDEGAYEWDVEKVKIKIMTKGGPQIILALTEQGLLKAIFHSKSDAAKKFQQFVHVVMMQLRKNGNVTIEEAAIEYKKENERLERIVHGYSVQLDIIQGKVVKLEARDEKREFVMMHQSEELYKSQKRLENARDKTAEEWKSIARRYERKYLKPLIAYVNTPPAEVLDEYPDFNIENYTEWDVDFVDSSEVLVWNVSFAALKKGVAIRKFYVHKEVSLDQIHEALQKMKAAIKKSTGGVYKLYESTLEQLEIVIDDLNRAQERSEGINDFE